MNNIMVLGSTLGRCETDHACRVKYGKGFCMNKNKKGVGHCSSGSIMSIITSFGGKRKTNKKKNKKRRKTNKKRKKTNKKRR